MAPVNVEKNLVAVVIASAGTASTAAAIGSNLVTGLLMPDMWTSANITFQGSFDGSVWYVVKNYSDGVAALATATLTAPIAGEAIPIDSTIFLPFQFVRVVSSVGQGAARTLYLATTGALVQA